eukprot:3415431-Rhodomonas_salina.1
MPAKSKAIAEQIISFCMKRVAYCICFTKRFRLLATLHLAMRMHSLLLACIGVLALAQVDYAHLTTHFSCTMTWTNTAAGATRCAWAMRRQRARSPNPSKRRKQRTPNAWHRREHLATGRPHRGTILASSSAFAMRCPAPTCVLP